jgi:hypothetical protein
MRLEILLSNYQETFKFAKELAFIYPINNPKRLALEKAMAEMQGQIQKLK